MKEKKRRTRREVEEKGRKIERGKVEAGGEELRLEDAEERERGGEEGRGRERKGVVLSNDGERTRGKAERRNSKIVENVHAPSSGWPRFSQDLLSRQHFSLSSLARDV